MNPLKDKDRTSDSPEVDDGDSFARLIVMLVIVPFLLLATYLMSQNPYTVRYYRQLDDFAAGKRVRFTCSYRGNAGPYTYLSFQGRPILLKLRPDEYGWTPKVGRACVVVGNVVKRNADLEDLAEFVITDGELHPASGR